MDGAIKPGSEWVSRFDVDRPRKFVMTGYGVGFLWGEPYLLLRVAGEPADDKVYVAAEPRFTANFRPCEEA